ncbi:MAG: alkylhydroperoxidase [Phycisphaera sp.]|nr:MAG: alkylhydroperoxidase [Phycisphaera sp.]
MAFIEIIPEDKAEGELAALYKRFGNPDGTVDNVLKVHSLNPASLDAHCALYVQSMHKPSPLSRAEREMIGVAVSRLNGCDYCKEHHAAGLKRLLPEDRKAVADELKADDLSSLSSRERALVVYASKLTTHPEAMSQGDVDALRAESITDREILDAAQSAAYFAYANRVVLGLGAKLGEGEGAIGEVPEESR